MRDQALVIVDVQNDFCPGGALPVENGDRVVPVLNKYLEDFFKKGCPVFATRDWHPHRTTHFKEFGGEWPAHCVQNTPGAEFHTKLKRDERILVISKGMDPEKDSYSGFQGVDHEGRSFLHNLKDKGCQKLFIGGLATDYCVRSTVLDALRHGFEVFLLADAIQGVNIKPRDSREAIEEMKRNGARLIEHKDMKALLEERS